MAMKINLIFMNWQKEGNWIVDSEENSYLSMGLFHGGTTFDGEIDLPPDAEMELRDALEKGYDPVVIIKI